MGSFWLTRVRFGSLNRCGMLKQKDCWGPTILEIRTFLSPRVTHKHLFQGYPQFLKLQSHPQKHVLVLVLPTETRFVFKLPTENRICSSLSTKEGFFEKLLTGERERLEATHIWSKILPKMWRFSWNLVQMWEFRHIVTSFFWVRLATKLGLDSYPGLDSLIPAILL